MRVLQITPYYVPSFRYGGPVNSICQLCEALVKEVDEVCVYTTGSKQEFGEHFYYQEINGVKVSYFNRYFYENAFFAPRLLLQVWRNAKKFDVIHLHLWWNLSTILSLFIVLMRGKKPVLSPRGTLSEYSFSHRNGFIKRTFQKLVGKYLFRKTFLHCTSEVERDQSTEFFYWKGISIIPNYIKIPPMEEGYGHSEINDHFKLLFLSRIDPIKGLHYLLYALAEVKFSYHLTIAGDGDEAYINYLKRIAEQSGISSKISWTGFVKGTGKHDLLVDNDLLVLTSETENFGNVVIESLSVGTPVLISRNVGLYDYVEENDLGWVCDLSKEDIINQLNAAYHDKVKRIYISRKSYHIIRKDFDPGILTGRYVSLYKSVLNERNYPLAAVH
jgi:glycosyltransferase involved in cell wall biosynthesis